MATLTITVPDKLASRLHALPSETMTRYAVAALLDAADEAEEAGLTPVRRADLPDAHVSAIEAGLADSVAGRVTNGETVLAQLRQMTGRGK